MWRMTSLGVEQKIKIAKGKKRLARAWQPT